MLSDVVLDMCSIRVFAKNKGDSYYEPTIVVHDILPIPLFLASAFLSTGSSTIWH